MSLPREVDRFARRLTRLLGTAIGDSLLGLYVHGSAALGGFVTGRSDVDVIVVVAGNLPSEVRIAAAKVLRQSHDENPGSAVEASIVTRTTAASGGTACAYELHFSTLPGDERVIYGGEHDPDLVLHFAVCRQSGVAFGGPPAVEVFAPVDAARLLGQIVAELRWSLDHGAPEYAVLNACRALRYHETGVLVSKLEGGAWALDRGLDRLLVSAALDAQSRNDGSLPRNTHVAPFVASILARITSG